MTAHNPKPVDPKEPHRERQAPDVAAEDLLADGPPYGSDSLPLPASAHPRLGRQVDHSAEWSVAVEALAELPYAVYAATAGGVLRYANRAMLKLLGASSLGELGQRPLGSFLSSGSDAPKTTLPTGQVRLRGVNNTEHHVEHVTFSALSKVSPAAYVCGVLRELEPVPGRGPSHLDRLAALGALTGSVAHDLSNLLITILGYASLADEDPLESEQAVGKIVEAAERARDLTKQLVDYAGRSTAEAREVDLNELVRETARLLEIAVPRGIRLSFDLTSDVPTIQAAPVHIRQVVMNLIINAAEAIGDGEGHIVVSTRRVRKSPLVRPDGGPDDRLPFADYAELAVKDTGRGMDEETRLRVFEPFFTSKDETGGLGLATVADLVSQAGGAIEIESAPGSGATFCILLPEINPIPAKARSKMILIVDDESAVRREARSTLERDGFRVLEAATGTEALEIYRRHQANLALVVLDLKSPITEAVEVFQEMTRIRPDIRVLFSSRSLQDDVASQLHEVGFAGFLHKPFTPQTFLDHVRSIVSD